MEEAILAAIKSLHEDLHDFRTEVRIRLDQIEAKIATGVAAQADLRSIDDYINLDEKSVVNAVENFATAILGDVHLFKSYYMADGRECPLRKKGAKIEYWSSGEWKQINKTDLAKIIAGKLQFCYMEHSNLDKHGEILFQKMQERISNLTTPSHINAIVSKLLN